VIMRFLGRTGWRPLAAWAAFWAASAGGALMPSFIRADALNDHMLEMMQQVGDDTTMSTRSVSAWQ